MKTLTTLILICISGYAISQKRPKDLGHYDTLKVSMITRDTANKVTKPLTGYKVTKVTARHYIEVFHLDGNKRKLPKTVIVTAEQKL